MKSEKMCKVEGCTNPAKVRGVCLSCYKKWRDGKLDGFPPFTVVGKKISAGMKKARATKRQGSEVGSQRAEAEAAEKQLSIVTPGARDAGDGVMEKRAADHVDSLLSAVMPVARPLMIQAFIQGHQCRGEDSEKS